MIKTNILHLRTCKEGRNLPRSRKMIASLLRNKILKQFIGYVAFHIIQRRFVMHFSPIIIFFSYCSKLTLCSFFRVLNQTTNSICRTTTAYMLLKKEMMIKIKMNLTVMKMEGANHQQRRRLPPKTQEGIRRHHHKLLLIKIYRKTTI